MQNLTGTLTAGVLTGVVSIAISLIVMYVPGVNARFAEKSTEFKQLFFLGVLALVSILILASSCLNLVVWVTCDENGFTQMLSILVSIAIGGGMNQGVYKLLPQPAVVKLVKALRKSLMDHLEADPQTE